MSGSDQRLLVVRCSLHGLLGKTHSSSPPTQTRNLSVEAPELSVSPSSSSSVLQSLLLLTLSFSEEEEGGAALMLPWLDVWEHRMPSWKRQPVQCLINNHDDALLYSTAAQTLSK